MISRLYVMGCGVDNEQGAGALRPANDGAPSEGRRLRARHLARRAAWFTREPWALATATRLLEAALALDAGQPSAWASLGAARERQGDTGVAERCYRRALALDGDDAATACALGRLLVGRGAAAEGERWLREAQAIDPDRVEVYAALARAVAAQGRDHEANELAELHAELASATIGGAS